MKFLFSLALTYSFALVAGAQVVVTSGHFDLSVTYDPETQTWDNGIFDYDSNVYHGPDAFIFEAGDSVLEEIPSGEPWDLIGPAGEPVWRLPEIFEDGEIFLGFGTQRLERNIFTGGLSNRGRINIRLASVTGSGPDAGGTLTMWNAGFPPIVHYATGDGIGVEDALLDVPGGTHSHYNWAFSKPGDYFVTFEISGELLEEHGGGMISTEVTYQFRVAGESSELPGFLAGPETGGGWRFGEQLGFFNTDFYPWLFHDRHGWWLVVGLGDDNGFIWDRGLGWLWTSHAAYPWLYSAERGAWVFFDLSPAEGGLRWFFQEGEGWFSFPKN